MLWQGCRIRHISHMGGASLTGKNVARGVPYSWTKVHLLCYRLCYALKGCGIIEVRVNSIKAQRW